MDIEKNCPFCGEIDDAEPGKFWIGEYEYYAVRCQNCGALGPDCMDEEQAIEAWNERVK